MTTKRTKKTQTKYTLAEIKEKYFPNRDLSSLKNRDENTITRETFMNILEKIARPASKQPTVKRKRT